MIREAVRKPLSVEIEIVLCRELPTNSDANFGSMITYECLPFRVEKNVKQSKKLTRFRIDIDKASYMLADSNKHPGQACGITLKIGTP